MLRWCLFLLLFGCDYNQIQPNVQVVVTTLSGNKQFVINNVVTHVDTNLTKITLNLTFGDVIEINSDNNYLILTAKANIIKVNKIYRFNTLDNISINPNQAIFKVN
jgi:hypothetical protein